MNVLASPAEKPAPLPVRSWSPHVDVIAPRASDPITASGLQADHLLDAWEWLRHLDPLCALIVIPCSGTKSHAATMPSEGGTIGGHLPATVAGALVTARLAVARHAQLDESVLQPAWCRYGGEFYKAAHDTLEGAVHSDAHVLILSGGYGVVLATEPIDTYNAIFQSGRWPQHLVGQCLLAYAKRHDLSAVVAFLSAHTGYAKVVRSVRWRDNGIDHSYLASPDLGGKKGGMVLVPRAAGQAFAAFWRRQLSVDWQSSGGIRLSLESLP